MARVRVLLTVLALSGLVSSCSAVQPAGEGHAADVSVPTASQTSRTQAPQPNTDPPGNSSPATAASDRSLAPNFTLDLGDGGTFVLAEETRPVYLVFWAEW